MTTPKLPLIFDQNNDDRPLPLIVAQQWDFPLAHVRDQEIYMYSIQDWIRGLLRATSVTTIWADIRRRANLLEQLDSIQELPYQAANGKTYQMDFGDDKALYLIAQHLRVTKSRPVLNEIKQYLASAGVFVDLVRREPETVITSGAIDPDKAIDAAIAAYRAQGKSDKWINARLTGKIKREQFTRALQAAVAETLLRKHYAMATDEVYLGLWGRTAAYLKNELELPSRASLRDHQPEIALSYQGLAEQVAAQKLGDQTEISWVEAKYIVRIVADMIGEQAQVTAKFLGMDLPTGKPLLPKNM